MNSHTQDSPAPMSNVLWEGIASVINELNDFVDQIDDIDNGSALLIQRLLEVEELPGITTPELSVVYCEYGTKNYEFIAYQGSIDVPQNTLFQVDNKYIKNTVTDDLRAEEYPWFKTAAECKAAGFGGFQTVMLVPMRLRKARRLGAFIIHSTDREDAYSLTLQTIFDTLSDRLAGLIQALRRNLRDQLTYQLRNRLLSRIGSDNADNHFKSECEILSEVQSYLTEHWYTKDEIHILIKNSLDVDTYHPASTESGLKIARNFRSKQVLSAGDTLSDKEQCRRLHHIIGGDDNLKALQMASVENNRRKGNPTRKLHGFIKAPKDLKDINPSCQSWLGVTMNHPGGYIFGHIILHNTAMPHAYDKDDLRFVESLADFLGFMLAEYRQQQKNAIIQKLASLPLTGREQLCQATADYLRRLYGVKQLQIRAIDFSSQEWEVIYPTSGAPNNLILEESEEEELQNAVVRFADHHRKRPDYNSPLCKLRVKQSNYLATPMRAGCSDQDWLIAGVFLIPAKNPGKVASQVIDEVSDALGERLETAHTQHRQQDLNMFNDAVSCLASQDLSQEHILNVAKKYISEVMFSDNLYIALYDEAEDSIVFPLIYKDGVAWEDMLNTKRVIDNKALGRTEVIIRSKNPLLIKTKAASIEWYKPPHKDHAGDPLASWVGVPIFTTTDIVEEPKVLGVIAAFHPDLDYVYSDQDVFFLRSVAAGVSGLFQLLKLDRANRQLEEAITNNTALKEANKVIMQLEEEKSYIITARDLTHRIRNSSAIILNYVDRVRKKINKYSESGSEESLQRALSSLSPIEKQARDLIESVNRIMSGINTKSTIDINDLLERATRNLHETINHSVLSIRFVESFGVEDTIESREPPLYDSIFHILDNAVEAIEEHKQERSSQQRDYYIKCFAKQEGDNITITIEDNGIPIDEANKENIFTLGFSTKSSSSNNNDEVEEKYRGYGLYRSRHHIESLGGTLRLSRSDESHKEFEITLPLTKAADKEGERT